MRIIANKCYLGELSPGEIYSFADQDHWRIVTHAPDEAVRLGVATSTAGHMVFIRSDDPLDPDRMNDIVYRIEIHND